MKAMILAAGRGERLRPLTDQIPKPLLPVGGRPLIDYHLEALAAASVTDVVVNAAWLKEQLVVYLGNGGKFGVNLTISDEGEAALETGGGVHHALPLLGSEPFWLVNGDVFVEYSFLAPELSADVLAHLLLVPNPEHNPAGDFALEAGRVSNHGQAMLTYSGVAVLRPELFASCRAGAFPLAPLLREAAAAGRVSGEVLSSYWCDVGTPDRLNSLEQHLQLRRV